MGCGRLEPFTVKAVWAVLRGGGGGDVRPLTRQAEARWATALSTVTEVLAEVRAYGTGNATE